jgi:hypothetical protein
MCDETIAKALAPEGFCTTQALRLRARLDAISARLDAQRPVLPSGDSWEIYSEWDRDGTRIQWHPLSFMHKLDGK